MGTSVISGSPRTTSRRRAQTLRYVYGIVPAPAPLRLDVAGIDNWGKVRTVCRGSVGAVVSATDRGDYRRMTRDDALRYLVAHQQVLEAVTAHGTVLPVRFGTVLAGDGAVGRLLDQGRALFAATLAEFSGTRQMEVVATWNVEEVFKEIAADAEIVRAKEDAARQPAGQVAAAGIAVGRMVKDALDRRRGAVQARLLSRLLDGALDLAANPLLDDRMVCNVAVLVDERGGEALDRALTELDGEFDGRLRFRCVGPLPPYSFATVTVDTPDVAAVDEARRRLGLDGCTTAGQIKRAYRQLAARVHPDVNPEAGADGRMAVLSDAYHLLTAYASGATANGGGAGDVPVAFDPETAARTLLISVTRQETAGHGAGRG